MVRETRAALPDFLPGNLLRIAGDTALGSDFFHPMAIERGGCIGNAAPVDSNTHMSIPLVIGERTHRAIDWDFVEIWTAQAAKLGVVVGKIPPLQEWVIAEINARDHVGSHECDLFRLREIIVW